MRAHAGCLVLALACGACASIGDMGPPSVGAVQSIAVRDCAFLPTAEVAAKIIKANAPGLNSNRPIASAICVATDPKVGTSHAKVAGIAIEGLRVRP